MAWSFPAHRQQVLKLAQNQEKYLRHGWFVVRNRTPAEAECGIVAHERDVREQGFFNNLPWNILPKSRRGVQALKKFLADLLCARIQMGFPSMLETIQSRRSEAASELDALGTPRKSLSQKRDYIAEIARKFNKEASLTLDGRYGSLKNDKLKLRREIRDANDVFMREIKLNGHLIPFSEIPYVADTALESNGLGPSSSETNATGLLSVSQHHDIEAHEPRDINEDSSSSEYERGTRPSKVSLQSNSFESDSYLMREQRHRPMDSTLVVCLRQIPVLTDGNACHLVA